MSLPLPRTTRRRPLDTALLAFLVALLSAGCQPKPLPEDPLARLSQAGIDHHVHLLGEDLLRDWQALGATFSKPPEAYLTAGRLLGAPGGAAGSSPVARAVLVSMAHFYGSDEMREGLQLTAEEEQARVARENDHVAREAARYPGRAVALCSAALLRPYAMDELTRCQRDNAAAGIKLHVASSGVDLREPAHLEAVEKVAAWAEEKGLPILLHLDTQRRGTTVDHVQQFAQAVLAPHPRLTVIVAHLGGSGGYGPWTQSVYRTLTAWLAERAAAEAVARPVYFDLSAVLLEKPSEGVPATTAEEARALAADLRAAGLERLVLGSDYPVFDPRNTLTALGERAGLTAAELATIASRTPPGLFS